MLDLFLNSNSEEWEKVGEKFIYKKDRKLELEKILDSRFEIPKEKTVRYTYHILYNNEFLDKVGVAEMDFEGILEIICVPIGRHFDLEVGMKAAEIVERNSFIN